MDPLAAWASRDPALSLSVFIDDLMSDNTSATEHQVTGRLAAGAADLRLTVEQELGCHIADHKSAAAAYWSVAGRPLAASLARRVRRRQT